MQAQSRDEVLLEIKREQSEYYMNNRKLLSELQDKDNEILAIQEDFSKAMQENKAYEERF